MGGGVNYSVGDPGLSRYISLSLAGVGSGPATVCAGTSAAAQGFSMAIEGAYRDCGATRGRVRAGKLLSKYSDRLIALAADALAAMRDLQDVKTGRMFIGASQTTGVYILPRLIGAVRAQSPLPLGPVTEWTELSFARHHCRPSGLNMCVVVRLTRGAINIANDNEG